MTQAYNLSQLANNLNSIGQLDATDGLVNAVPATNGGTGQAAYAVGDLLYAPTTTTLNKLADVVVGNALISGGVGVVPAYGKIGMTTHVSGILPVPNGGTGAGTLASNNVLLGNGVGALQVVAPGTSGNALISNGTTWASTVMTLPIGTGQTWQDVTSLRTSGITYTNSTSKAIMVSINIVSGSCSASVGGVTVIFSSAANGNTSTQNSFIVPNGATYIVIASGISFWVELR
jgi:hypothetical protein